MNRIRPALVHTFLFHANVVGRLAAWIACGGPVLASVRVAERRYRHHLILENLTCRLSQRVICVSRAAAQFTRRRSHVPSARLVIIPNGINADAVRLANPVDRASLGITEDSALAVYVGRLDPQKGVDVLLDAMRCAVRLVPELHLVLAGIGPHENQLIGLARSLGVERNVHFLGWRDDVPALLRTADFLVLSSRWEGMPNVVLEAMAAGRPVVATRTEGTTDLVRHGETGVLVSIDDSASLATALVEIARNRDQRSHWGRRGEELVRREFSLSRMLTRYEALYELSLGQSSSRIRV
jgi:starch synthase (maltosyl-transferring)